MKSNEYKDKIVEALMLDDKISQALYNTQDNFLDSIPTPQNKLSLRYNNIFPYFLVIEIQDKVESYIFMDFEFMYNKNSTIAEVVVEFKIFVHREIMRTDASILRMDFITERLKEIFHGHDCNLGAQLYVVNEKSLPSYRDKYLVSRLVFKTISVGH